jgi:hypothetical protein
MVVAKIPGNYDKDVLTELLKTMTLTEIASKIDVNKATLKRHCDKLGVINPRAKQKTICKMNAKSQQLNTTSNHNNGGASAQTKSILKSPSKNPNPHPKIAEPPIPDESEPIINLTPELIENAILKNLQRPNKDATAAITLAKQWLETKSKLNINERDEEELANVVKQSDSSELLAVIKPILDAQPTSLNENLEIDYAADD